MCRSLYSLFHLNPPQPHHVSSLHARGFCLVTKYTNKKTAYHKLSSNLSFTICIITKNNICAHMLSREANNNFQDKHLVVLFFFLSLLLNPLRSMFLGSNFLQISINSNSIPSSCTWMIVVPRSSSCSDGGSNL